MSAERRRAPRIRSTIPVALSEGTWDLKADTRDLSTAGVCCLLDRFVPPMTRIQLELELPTDGAVSRARCGGVVVRVDPVITAGQQSRYAVAIFFSDLAARDRAAIERYVRQRLAAAPPR